MYFPLNLFVLQVPYLDPIFYPNFGQLLLPGYYIINFFSSQLLQPAFPTKIRLETASPCFFTQVSFCAHCLFFLNFSLVITLSSGIQPPLKGTKPLANHSILYLILYSSMISLNAFLYIGQVQNFCPQLISNSDFIPCPCFVSNRCCT